MNINMFLVPTGSHDSTQVHPYVSAVNFPCFLQQNHQQFSSYKCFNAFKFVDRNLQRNRTRFSCS